MTDLGLGFFNYDHCWISTAKYPLLEALLFVNQHRNELEFKREGDKNEEDVLIVSPKEDALEYFATIQDLKHAILWIIDPDHWLGTRLMEFLVENLHGKVRTDYYWGQRLGYATGEKKWMEELLDYSEIDESFHAHDVARFAKAVCDKHTQWETAAEKYGVPIEDVTA